MGGCYSYDYSRPARVEPEKPAWERILKRALANSDRALLTDAYKKFFLDSSSGFILEAAKMLGIKKTEEIPKEFPEWEYEFKFDVQINGKGDEPGIESYLDTFDFPVAKNGRFLKDPVNSIATGTNRFYGVEGEEKLVVITKGGKLFLKEKGEVVPVKTGVQYENWVMKRKEIRYPVELDSAIDKMAEIASETGAIYQGKIRKEKGDVFIMDSNDGRLYGFTITRAHLTRPGQKKETLSQRQLEIEYAGYLPGFKGFRLNNEEQMVAGMVDLAKYTFNMYMQSPISNGWRLTLSPTIERKIDFVSGSKSQKPQQKLLEAVLN